MEVAVVGPIVEKAWSSCLWDPIVRQFRCLRSLKKNVESLSGKMGELRAKERDIMEKLETEKVKHSKKPNAVTDLWLKTVGEITGKVGNIVKEFEENKKCLKGCLPNYYGRVKLSKLAADTIRKVDELEKKKLNDLFADPKPPIGLKLSTTTPVGKSAEITLERVWESVMDAETGIIGLCGMGGSGKTTIMKKINDRLVNECKLFDKIIWVTVSKVLNSEKLQNVIANALKLGDMTKTDEATRVGNLLAKLNLLKFVLILDDVWEEVSLGQVGIPPPSKENGCKILLTTRKSDVCDRMNCQKSIKMETLSEEEAWELFEQNVGIDEAFTPEVEKIAKDVAKECARLPLAIITVGSAMRKKTDVRAWRIALYDLRSSKDKDMTDEVLPQLKFSFDHLSDNRVRECFLYCALYPEDYYIPCQELVNYWIAEGLIDDYKDWEVKMDMGYVVLEELKNSCMLENVVREYVTMHDLIRDMAINITSQSNRFIVNAGVGLTGSLEKEKWAEGVERISLMSNRIDALPNQRNCPNLSTLLLQGNPLSRNISHSFFEQMHNLRVLNLSGTRIMYLPESLSGLKQLRALLLEKCGELKQIPSLSSLTELRVLKLRKAGIEALPHGSMKGAVNLSHIDLSHTSIEYLPESLLGLENLRELLLEYCGNIKTLPSLSRLRELRELNLEGSSIETLPESLSDLVNLRVVNLRYVNLKNTRNLQLFPAGILPNLTRLEELLMSSSGWKWRESNLGGGAGIEDIISLSHLGHLEIDFEGLQGWTPYFTSEKWKSLKCFHFNIGDVEKYTYLRRFDHQIKIGGCDIVNQERSGMFPDNTESLYMEDCICRVSLFSNLKDLRRLEIYGCGGIEKGTDIVEATMLSKLEMVSVIECHEMKTVFPLRLFQHLSNLEEIEVRDCEEIEEIAGGEAGEEGEIIAEASNSAVTLLPQLEKLYLTNLPKLRRVCKRELVCESLAHIEVENCPLLKKLPFSVDNILPSLKNITVSNCEEIEEITAGEEGEIIAEASNSAITLLPQLQFLSLEDLPKLRRVCKRELVCISLEYIIVTNCPLLKKLPFSVDNIPPSLKGINVFNCEEIEEITGGEAAGEEVEIIVEASNSAITLLPQLWYLYLKDLPKLRRVCKRELVCKSLQNILVMNCPLLKKLPFSVDNIPPSLEEIEVRNCEEIEEIAGEAGEEGEIIAEASNSSITLLPQLEKLYLKDLPKLRRVCKRELVCESLRYIQVRNCPLLKKLPFSVDNIPPSLEKIEGETEWWDALKWDDPNTKILLQPFFVDYN